MIGQHNINELQSIFTHVIHQIGVLKLRMNFAKFK